MKKSKFPKEEYYFRAVKLKLFLTDKKKRKVKSLIEAYRKAVNYFLNYLFYVGGELTTEVSEHLFKTKLSSRYRDQALKQAIDILKTLKESLEERKEKLEDFKYPPKFKGYPKLDTKFINREEGNNSFDLWFRLSNLAKGKKIYLPSKKTRKLNEWLEKGELTNSCELQEEFIIVYVAVKKEPLRTDGKNQSIDLNMDEQFLTTSEEKVYGEKYPLLIDKIQRKQKGSKAYKRAITEKNNYVNESLKKIKFNELNYFFYENLKGISQGKNGFRKNKGFRKRQQYWSHRKVRMRIEDLCMENRVYPVYVDPRNTSRCCPVCNNIDARNRKTVKVFECISCGYSQASGIVGATNILAKGLRWLEECRVPQQKRKTTLVRNS